MLLPELRALLPCQGCFLPCQTPSLIFRACHSQLPASHCHQGPGKEMRMRNSGTEPPHCEGDVDSQPMHFNTGKLLGKPEGCAWGPESTVFAPSVDLELMPPFPPRPGNCSNHSPTQGSPPTKQGFAAPLLKFHKHLLTQEWPSGWQYYLKSNEKAPFPQNSLFPGA